MAGLRVGGHLGFLCGVAVAAAGDSLQSINPPARRQPTVASQVVDGTTGQGSGGVGGATAHPSNQAPEEHGSIPGAAWKCLRKLRST